MKKTSLYAHAKLLFDSKQTLRKQKTTINTYHKLLEQRISIADTPNKVINKENNKLCTCSQ